MALSKPQACGAVCGAVSLKQHAAVGSPHRLKTHEISAVTEIPESFLKRRARSARRPDSASIQATRSLLTRIIDMLPGSDYDQRWRFSDLYSQRSGNERYLTPTSAKVAIQTAPVRPTLARSTKSQSASVTTPAYRTGVVKPTSFSSPVFTTDAINRVLRSVSVYITPDCCSDGGTAFGRFVQRPRFQRKAWRWSSRLNRISALASRTR